MYVPSLENESVDRCAVVVLPETARAALPQPVEMKAEGGMGVVGDWRRTTGECWLGLKGEYFEGAGDVRVTWR